VISAGVKTLISVLLFRDSLDENNDPVLAFNKPTPSIVNAL
jgi:hypothetical protein